MPNKKIKKIDENAIVLKVKQTTIDERGLYGAARYAWTLNINNAAQAEYVIVATTGDGIIKEVYKNVKWRYTKDKDRIEFDADVANDDIRIKYLFNILPDDYMQQGPAKPQYTFDTISNYQPDYDTNPIYRY